MMLAAITVFPTDRGESVSAYVARVIAVIAESGLSYRLTAMNTIVEGSPEAIFDLLPRCHAALAKDCGRIYMTVTIDDRRDQSGRMAGKVASVERELADISRDASPSAPGVDPRDA